MINQLLTFKILYVPKDQREIGPANPASLWFQWCTQGENHWGKLQGSQLIINSSIHIMTDLTDLSGWFSQKPSKILGSCWVCRMVKEHMTISILQDLAMDNPWELIIFDRETTQATSQVPLFNISTQLWSIAYSVWWDTWFTYSKWRFSRKQLNSYPFTRHARDDAMHGLHGWQHARHGWQHARHGRHARRESQGRCEDFWAVPITIFQIFQDLAATSWGPQDI